MIMTFIVSLWIAAESLSCLSIFSDSVIFFTCNVAISFLRKGRCKEEHMISKVKIPMNYAHTSDLASKVIET